MVEHGRRRFMYKYPTFGKKGDSKSTNNQENSPYYWWWRYLKLSERYLRTCERNGAGSLGGLYAQFGDVRGDDFKAWWNHGNRGARLFAEPNPADIVRVITVRSEFVADATTLVISFPLNLPKRYLMKRTRQLLVKHHSGRRGHRSVKKSQAMFQVRGRPDTKAYAIGLLVYGFREANKKMSLWQIAEELRLIPGKRTVKGVPTKKDKADRRNVYAATVSRYLRRVRASIAATERGQFP